MARSPTDDKTKGPAAAGPPPASYSTRPSRVPQVSRPNLPVMPKIGGWLNRAIILAIICLLLGFGGGWLGARTYNDTNHGTASTAAKQRYISDESDLIASTAKTIGSSVVSIDVQSQVTTPDFFGFGQQQTQESAGTGFVIDGSGVIMTNRHVVPAGTDSVSVTLADGTQYDNVKVIGRTSESNPLDVAFLKIGDLKGKKLVPLTLADSSKMQVGDRVIAIGNALGQFQNTVTTGIISGYGRDVTASDQAGASAENLTDLFQTDAAINAGNSGGPLVNINGEVIGLNTAVASGAQNIGFAIPINDLKSLINSVLVTGELRQPYLGVRYVSLTNDLAQQFDLKITRGAYVISGDNQPAIVSGSPAEKAGLKEKDVIIQVDNTHIDQKTSLTAALSQHKVGEQVTLRVVRAGKTITLHATLGNAPSS